MSEYPVQFEKVQAPPLRDETLARPRLLDWLTVKIHRRVVLVLAEAGYGKTTLLADFTRRSRVPVAWYRLDRGDRDWLGFLAHLVAAFRVHRPDFAPVTQAMIRDASMGTSTRDMVLEALIRELGTLAAEPASIVLDDFHLVDDSEDARAIVRALLARAPERLTFVLISRTVPSLPLARLRALGEVAELETADLRFDPDETHQLFRDTYAMDLEPGIVAELSRRTEGWVASLQLVRAAIRDRNRSEIRAFVRSLSGAEGNLYDYLAEEVVGELPADLQQFLMRTSLLEVIEPVLAAVAAADTAGHTKASIADGEMLGLFSRIGPNTRDHVRAHPLVRDFLQARLLRSIGHGAVIEIHRAIAGAAEPLDWRIAGHHYLEAGDLDDARRVLAAAIESILATGAYAAAEELVTALPTTDEPDPNVLVILSRLAQQRGESRLGLELAEAALTRSGDQAAVALTAMSARLIAGDIDGAATLADGLSAQRASSEAGAIGAATALMLGTSLDGEIGPAIDAVSEAVAWSRQRGGLHYVGVGLSNLGYLLKAQGNAIEALRVADEAVDLLTATSGGTELVSAHLLRAWAVAHLGDLAKARSEVSLATGIARGDQALEVAYEAAEIEALYGDPGVAMNHLNRVGGIVTGDTDGGEQALVALLLALTSSAKVDDARPLVDQLHFGALRSSVAFEARRLFAAASVAALTTSEDVATLASASYELSSAQGAHLWARSAGIFAAASDPPLFASVVGRELIADPSTLSIAAVMVARHLDWLDRATRDSVAAEVRRRPERWRGPLRFAVQAPGDARSDAARLLDEVGAREDVPLLRKLARSAKGDSFPANAGRALARRLAPTIYVEDLGRVSIQIGANRIEGNAVRRKVLALLTYLVSRPRFAAAREEVLEALWPDLEPGTALNSLNQTVYFLRRVFESDYAEDTSPGYVGQDGETLWLDVELVRSRGRDCRDMIRNMAMPPDPTAVFELARAYHGRFALDFLYEDWASNYRDSLHAAYLRIVEASVRSDTDSGHFARGIEVAQLALDADPEAEALQLALTRLYRLSGSMAAAAEQYQHYAKSQRELGLEPDPFDRI